MLKPINIQLKFIKEKKNCHFKPSELKQTLHEKPYFPGPGISWKAQKDQVNIIFPSAFWLKKRSYFPSPKSPKQELLGNQ